LIDGAAKSNSPPQKDSEGIYEHSIWQKGDDQVSLL
jgi:hypothetical protein